MQRRSKMVLGKLSRHEGSKKGKAPRNQQRKILRNIERALVKTGMGMAVEIDLGRHYSHLELENIRIFF